MSITPNPTITSLVMEGLYQSGDYNPMTSVITRATTIWVQQILNMIWTLVKKPETLHVTAYTVINQGQSRYAYPTDYSSNLTMSILYGTDTGACQAATSNSIMLASTDVSGVNIIGSEIIMMAGPSAGSYSQITAYNTITKVASMVPNWTITPTVGDTYMLIDTEYPVETRMINEWDRSTKYITPFIPQYLYPVGDAETGYFVLDSPPDKAYGARLRYYSDLMLLDSTSSVMSTIYRKWQNVFIEGIRLRKLMEDDDDRAPTSMQEYSKQLMSLIRREMYGMDDVQLMDKIADYY